MWTLIPGQIAPVVFAHVLASMWRAMAGRSPHEAIFLQPTALDMNPYEMIVASLDVQGAFPHAPHRLLTDLWDAMGLPFLSFMTGYIQTRLYAVITAAGLTLWTGTDSGIPQGGADAPSSTSSSPPRWHLSWHGYTRDTPHTRYGPLSSTSRTTTS